MEVSGFGGKARQREREPQEIAGEADVLGMSNEETNEAGGSVETQSFQVYMGAADAATRARVALEAAQEGYERAVSAAEDARDAWWATQACSGACGGLRVVG